MELTLTCSIDKYIHIHCNNEFSHIADLYQLSFLSRSAHMPSVHDLEIYGSVLFQVLFPANTLASYTLGEETNSVLLVLKGPQLDAIPWEYACGPQGFLALTFPLMADSVLINGIAISHMVM